MRGDYLVLNAFRTAAHANYVNLRALFQEPRQGVAQQSVFGQEVNVNLRGQLEIIWLSHIHPQFNSSFREGETSSAGGGGAQRHFNYLAAAFYWQAD
jgi:hypothetical protein